MFEEVKRQDSQSEIKCPRCQQTFWVEGEVEECPVCCLRNVGPDEKGWNEMNQPWADPTLSKRTFILMWGNFTIVKLCMIGKEFILPMEVIRSWTGLEGNVFKIVRTDGVPASWIKKEDWVRMKLCDVLLRNENIGFWIYFNKIPSHPWEN